VSAGSVAAYRRGYAFASRNWHQTDRGGNDTLHAMDTDRWSSDSGALTDAITLQHRVWRTKLVMGGPPVTTCTWAWCVEAT
jgi:hypothetical protein